MAKKRRIELFEAFGERKSLRAWARDSRCRVSYWRLHRRITVLGLPLEAVLTGDPTPMSHGGGIREQGPVVLTFEGETKRVFEWAKDPRCKVTAVGLRTRIGRGWPAAEAITTPPHGPPPPNLKRRRIKKEDNHPYLDKANYDPR